MHNPNDPKLRKELKDDLDKLFGRGKYNSPANICFGDGYYARSLVEKWGADVSHLEDILKSNKRAGR